ncbi:MAG: lysoplasmalogenase family protein, partial [Spirochaetota bacterium]
LFFTSDIFVARNKFVADGFINRLLGLPLYYGGQFLLALSIGWL